MLGRPPAPYRVPILEEWVIVILDQGVRGEGEKSISDIRAGGTGDFSFRSGRWGTVHGPATALRTDEGAYYVWGVLLEDGRRVFCRKMSGLWQRRSDNGRSWTLGKIIFTPDDVRFSDGAPFRYPVHLTDNVFEIAMQPNAEFIYELRDDAVAWSLMELLRGQGVCTLEGKVGWNPSTSEAAFTIARLRQFGEQEFDFKYGYGDVGRVDEDVLIHILNDAGWRVQTNDEERRFSPRSFKA
jgi:hypothetical protein